MAESLHDFLKGSQPVGTPVSGAFECQECRESCETGYLDEEFIITWKCSSGHVSKVSI